MGGIPYLLLQSNLLKTETPSKVYLTVYEMLSYLVLKSQNEKKKIFTHSGCLNNRLLVVPSMPNQEQ